MREIEVKARIPNLAPFEQELVSLGVVLSKPFYQVDTIYVPAPLTLDEVDAHTTPILRLRSEDDSLHKFTLKMDATPGDPLNNIEHEVIISDPAAMHAALVLLGQHATVRVAKVRRTARYGDYDLTLDSVEGLGDYVEVEVLTADVDPDVVALRSGMWSFLEGIGLDRSLEETQSYDRQMIETQGVHE